MRPHRSERIEFRFLDFHGLDRVFDTLHEVVDDVGELMKRDRTNRILETRIGMVHRCVSFLCNVKRLGLGQGNRSAGNPCRNSLPWL